MSELQQGLMREEMEEERRRAAARGASSLPSPRLPQPPQPREQFSPGGGSGSGSHHASHHPSAAAAEAKRNERGVGLDVHELLKREAFAAQQGSCDDHFEKNRPCPSGIYGISDQYMVLDSFNKLRESRVSNGEFQWNFMVQGVTGDQVIGVRDKIDTVIEIQMGPFTMPILEDVPYVLAAAPPASPSGTNKLVLIHNNANGASGAPTLIPNAAGYGQYPEGVLVPAATTRTPWINNPYTQLPNGNRLTVQIREAGLQSFSDRNGARHHFEFTTRYLERTGHNPTMIQALPVSGDWERYIFTDPLKDVHGVTLVFRNPDIPVRFLPDCLYEVSVVSDAAAAPGPFLRFDSTDHGLDMGDRVFISGFRSGVAVLDTYVNRPEGHVVAGDPAVAPLPPGTSLASAGHASRFWTDPAISIIDFAPAPALPQVVTVCIAKRRLLIPMRLRRVVDRLTQYIAP